MNKKLKVCVAGASGFVGQELIKLLVKHPHVEIMHLFVNNLESQDTELIKKHKLPDFKKIDIKLINDSDVLFSAMPHTYSQSIIKSVSENLVVLDLSADFRLSNAETYENWYNVKHESKDLLKSLKSFSFFPSISFVAIFANGTPIDLLIKGTVLLALGFTSKTKTFSSLIAY